MHRAVVVLFLASGCAFSLAGPDPHRPRAQAPQCDTGKGLVVLDGLVAATAGVVAVAIAGDSEPGLALLPLSIGALYAGGAIRGNSNVNNCRAAMAGYESYLASRSAVPPRDLFEGGDPRDPGRRPGAIDPVPPSRPAQTVASPMPVASTGTAPAAPPFAAAAPVAEVPATLPPTARPPAPQPLPAQAADDDWSAFWREVQ